MPVEHSDTIAQLVWAGYSEQDITRNLGVTHVEIVLACWASVQSGAPIWRKRWGEWANRECGAMAMTMQPQDIPLPPSSKEAE